MLALTVLLEAGLRVRGLDDDPLGGAQRLVVEEPCDPGGGLGDVRHLQPDDLVIAEDETLVVNLGDLQPRRS